VAFPLSVTLGVASPKSIVIDVIEQPVEGVAPMVNVVVTLGCGLDDAETVTASPGRATTVTDVVVVATSPNESTPVTKTR